MATKRKFSAVNEDATERKRRRIIDERTCSLSLTGLSRPNNAAKLRDWTQSLMLCNKRDPIPINFIWINPVCSLAIIVLDSISQAEELKLAIQTYAPELRVKYISATPELFTALRGLAATSSHSFEIPARNWKCERFFPRLTNSLLMDRPSFYLSTPYKDSVKVTCWIETLMSEQRMVIIDSCAGIGGNTVAFSQSSLVDQVFAIEINLVRFTALVNNCISLSLEKILPFRGDFVKWIRTDEFLSLAKTNSCVFVDPPWGGPEYKLLPVIDNLYFDGTDGDAPTSLSTVCIELLKQQHVSLIVLKLPFNFNFTALFKQLSAMFTLETQVLECLNIMFHALVNTQK